jgi:hypothetical protein
MRRKILKIRSLRQKRYLSIVLLTLIGIFLSPIHSFPENIERKSPDFQPLITPDRIPSRFKDRIFLVMKADKSLAYLHEPVTITIQLFSREVTLRDIQYPQLSHEYFSIREFDPPAEKREFKDGVSFEVIEFKTTLFGKKVGDFKLGPSRLRCKLLVAKQIEESTAPGERSAVDAYFGASEQYPLYLESLEIPFKIIPLPEKGKPSDFQGAVGSFDFFMEIHPRETRVGEPITLKMVIQGRGNFNTVTPPGIEAGTFFKGYEPQANIERDRIIYDQVFVPQSEAAGEIPMVQFTFFDPEKGKYQTLRRGPLPIKILKPDSEESRKMSGQPEPIGRDLLAIKGSPGRLRKKGDFLYHNPTFLLLQLWPLLVFSAWILIHKRRNRLKTDLRYARRQKAKGIAKEGIRKAEKALKKNVAIQFYDTLFKTLQDYVGNRFHLPSKSMTGEGLDEILELKDINGDTIKRLQDLFVECNRVRYAPSRIKKEDMELALIRLKEVISDLENQP